MDTWTLNPHVANNLQENTIMHFKTQTESVQAEFKAPSNLMDLQELPEIIRGSTETHDNDQQLDKQAPVIYKPSKILFVKKHSHAPHRTVGCTKISGVANHKVKDKSTIILISLEARFDNKWQSHEFQAAILPEITELNSSDHTESIKATLQALQSKMPEFVSLHGSYINIEHFQTKREKGDVSLLLGVCKIYFQPKILVQLVNGLAIAYMLCWKWSSGLGRCWYMRCILACSIV